MPPTLTPRQKVEAALARSLVRLPSALLQAVAGRQIELDGARLDLPSQVLLRLHRIARGGFDEQRSVARTRADFEVLAPLLSLPSPPLESVVTRQVPGGDGERPARLYRPRGWHPPGPGLLYLHGGGFVVGSLESHDLVCRALAVRGACLVVALDYRLSPEHKLPAALDDALAAFRWLHAEGPRLGLDRARLAVGGDSAGGNLAAALSQATLGEAARPAFQLLIYPAVDQTMSFPSIETFARGFLLEKRQIEWYRAQYLPGGHDRRDPRASPLYGPLAGLPPAFVCTAGFDPLRDEGDAFAERLARAGVAVEHRRYPGLYHGFLSMAGAIPAARAALDDAGAALRAALD